MRLLPRGTHSRWRSRWKQVSTSLEMFRAMLGDMERTILPSRGLGEGLTKMVTFDLQPQG